MRFHLSTACLLVGIPTLEPDATIPPVNAELAATKDDEGTIDHSGDIAGLPHCHAVLWVLFAAHECWPVVCCGSEKGMFPIQSANQGQPVTSTLTESVPEHGEDEDAHDGEDSAAAGEGGRHYRSCRHLESLVPEGDDGIASVEQWWSSSPDDVGHVREFHSVTLRARASSFVSS